MDAEVCPCCFSSAIVAGSTSPIDFTTQHFRPFLRRNLRYWLCHFNIHTGVEVPEGFRACLSCGLVWGRLPANKLRDFMEREKVPFPLRSKEAEAEL
jgi:hypothetical protein